VGVKATAVPREEPAGVEPYPAPRLGQPDAAGRAELHGEVVFAWDFPLPLRPGEGFQLLIWRTGDRAHPLAFDSGSNRELALNLDELPQLREAGPAEYQWSVVVVSMQTHEPVSPEAEPWPFVYVGPQPPPGEAGPLPPPVLVEPPSEAELGGAALFVWEWPHEPLGEQLFFDLRIWALPENELPPDARRPATGPTKQTRVEIELPGVPSIADHGPGDYLWSVVVVRRPCPDCPPEAAGEWGEPRLFHYVAP
jgi:hypothetical protein